MSDPPENKNLHHRPRQPQETPAGRSAKTSVALRWVLLIGGVALFNLFAAQGLTQLVETRLSNGLSQDAWMGIGALVAYALLLAIPFVPGVEIGLSLLIMQGSAVAPLILVATVAGLSLSYGVGSAFATTLPCSFLRSMGLPRACAFVESMKDLDRAERLQTLRDAAPHWLGGWVIKNRYILLAILVNLPGNSLVGGGGGILLLAGLSRLYSWPLVLLTLLLATSPIPVAVWIFGTDILH